jgi:hypothetical protein
MAATDEAPKHHDDAMSRWPVVEAAELSTNKAVDPRGGYVEGRVPPTLSECIGHKLTDCQYC